MTLSMRTRLAPRRRAIVLLLLCTGAFMSGCAHTKPLGQSFVALGGLLLGLSVLDAAGVMGSDCANVTTPSGGVMYTCSGNGTTPKPLDVIGIATGAALVGAGVALWTADSPAGASSQSQTAALPALPGGLSARGAWLNPRP